MAAKKAPVETAELIRTMLIVQLGLAGIPQQSIRTIVGCEMSRVSKILKHLKAKNRKGGS